MESNTAKKKIHAFSERSVQDNNLFSIVDDIKIAISWREIAHQYMNMRSTKFYAKLEEKNNESFTDEERIKLKHALIDLAERIKVCAEKIS